MNYIIKSVKHSTSKHILYWREHECGYTEILVEAGIYCEEQAKNIEARSGKNSVQLIPVTDHLVKKAVSQAKKVISSIEYEQILWTERFSRCMKDLADNKAKLDKLSDQMKELVS